MKADLHPSNYREVVFKDMSNDEIFHHSFNYRLKRNY